MSRFSCASSNVDLSGLIRRPRRRLLIGLGVALGLHLSLAQWRSLTVEQRMAKPLTTQFVKRAPRLTKPLELKKRPRPKRRTVRREMVAVKARAGQPASLQVAGTAAVLRGLARPASPVGRTPMSLGGVVEPSAVAQVIRSDREPENAFDTSLEMLDVDALDTGQYHAMVIQDPRDRRNVSGFLHLHPAYSVSMRQRGWHSIDSRTLRALVNLAAFMNRHTAIRVDIAPAVQFDSRELFKTPWVYVTSHEETKGFAITASESANLGEYLLSGGFILVEPVSSQGPRMIGTPWEMALRQTLEDALGSRGQVYERDWRFEPLPNGHPLYHCFFDFSQAPTCVEHLRSVGAIAVAPDYLEGITLDGRLVAIVSAKAYFYAWNDDFQGYGLDSTRQRQFGVNMLVFALTQEGSITQQVMQIVD